MEYKLTGYRRSDLVRLDIKINAEVPPAFAPHSTLYNRLYCRCALLLCMQQATAALAGMDNNAVALVILPVSATSCRSSTVIAHLHWSLL